MYCLQQGHMRGSVDCNFIWPCCKHYMHWPSSKRCLASCRFLQGAKNLWEGTPTSFKRALFKWR